MAGLRPAGQQALDQWMNRGLRQVTLPTGTRLQIRIPSADFLLRSGTMPQELRAMAVKFASTGISLEELDDAAIEQFLHMKNVLVAWSVRAIYTGDAELTDPVPNDDPGWQPITLTVGQIENAELDADDLGALASIAMRQQTPNQITAAVWRDLGLVSGETLDDAIARSEREEDGPTVGEFRGVREHDGSADAGADGEDVGMPAESDGRDPRSRDRARVRRSTVDQADR
jgi:hypothetical protein